MPLCLVAINDEDKNVSDNSLLLFDRLLGGFSARCMLFTCWRCCSHFGASSAPTFIDPVIGFSNDRAACA